MAAERNFYRCAECGNIVQLVHNGGGKLVCCGKDMVLLTENTVDASKEKHVPVVEKTANGWKVKVGSVEHPMEEKHYIMWIQLVAGGREYFKYLKPGDKPEAEFAVPAASVTAREYCNLHGLWKASF